MRTGAKVTDRILAVLRHDDPSGAVVLTAAGELDHYSAPQLSLAVREAPFTPQQPTILDLTGLAYCDSTGITVLITAYQRAQEHHGGFVIAGLSDDLMHLFRILGLHQMFTFAPDIAGAVELLNAARS